MSKAMKISGQSLTFVRRTLCFESCSFSAVEHCLVIFSVLRFTTYKYKVVLTGKFISDYVLEPVCCKKQRKKSRTRYWFAE